MAHYLILQPRTISVKGTLRRFHELVNIITKDQFRAFKPKYKKALFVSSADPEKDKLLYPQKAEIKHNRVERKAKAVVRPSWDFTRLPQSEYKAVGKAIGDKDIDALDAIRVKYQLAAKCMTCSYSHKSWLLSSFTNFIALA